MPQTAIARLLRISQASVWALLHGKAQPSLRTAALLAKFTHTRAVLQDGSLKFVPLKGARR